MLSKMSTVRIPPALLHHTQALDTNLSLQHADAALPSSSDCLTTAGASVDETATPGTATLTSTLDAAADDADASVAELLSSIVERSFSTLILKLFVQAIPLPESGAFFDTAQALRAVHTSPSSVRWKLQEVGAILRSLHARLDTTEARANPALHALRRYLSTALPWLDEVLGNWMVYELALADMRASKNWISATLTLFQHIERLLRKPAFFHIARQPAVQMWVGQFETARDILAKLKVFSALPGSASLEDYLSIFANGPCQADYLTRSIHALANALSAACTDGTRPATGSLSDQVFWLMRQLTNPSVVESMRPHLEMLLGGPAQVQQLTAIMHFSQALTERPGGQSSVQDMRWLVNTVAACACRPMLEGAGFTWLGALAQDAKVLSTVDVLLTTQPSPSAWPRLMATLSQAALSSASAWLQQPLAGTPTAPWALLGAERALGWLTGDAMVMPAAASAELAAFFREHHNLENWPALLTRASQSAYRLAKPYIAGHLLNDPVAAVTVRYADSLQTHTDWKQTLLWFAAQNTGENAWLANAYSHYTTVLITWKAYEALCLDDVEQSEAALRAVVRTLQDAQITHRFPQLAKLLDILPLLPTLRQVHNQLPDTAGLSWVERAELWQRSLRLANTVESRVAGERLSRCVESWLTDAAMLACERLAQTAWTPFASADAAPTTDLPRESAIHRQPSTPHQTALSTPTGGHTPALAAGLSLGTIGAGAILYGLWQFNRPEPEYSLVASPRDSRRGQVLPLVVGGAALVAAGCLAYPLLKSWLSSPEHTFGMAPEERARLMARYPDIERMLEQQALPEWGEFDEDTISSRSRRSARHVEPDAPTRGGTSTPGYATFEAQISGTLKAFIQDETQSEWIRLEAELLMEKASSDPFVKLVEGSERRATRALLRMMQSVLATAQDSEQDLDPDKQAALRQLWNVLHGLYITAQTGPSAAEVKAVAMLLRISPTLTFSEPPDAGHPSSPLSGTQTASSVRAILQAYAPILNPAFYFDKRIREIIADARADQDVAEVLEPDTLITITAAAHSLSNPNHDRKQLQNVTFNVTVKEYVTNQHIHIFKPLADSRAIYDFRLAPEHAILKKFDEIDLEAEMLDQLAQYQDDTDRMESLRKFHQAMIVDRCLAYLSSPSRFPAFADAVEGFLTNQRPASLLSFMGEIVTGAFCIRTSPTAALILSIDDPVSYHVLDQLHEYYADGAKRMLISRFPHTDEFAQWVFSKVSIRHASAHMYSKDKLKNRYFSLRVGTGLPQSNYRHVLASQPLQMSGKIWRSDLPDALIKHQFLRTQCDIDVMILTDSEIVTLHLLDCLKLFLSFAEITATVCLPSTGTLLSLAATFLVNVGLGAAAVGASLAQYTIADRYVERTAYAVDALVAMAALGLGASVAGSNLGILTTNRMLSVQNLRQLQRIYRDVKRTVKRQYANAPQVAGGPLELARPGNRLIAQGAPLKLKIPHSLATLKGQAAAGVVPRPKAPILNIDDATITRDVVAHFHYLESVAFKPFDVTTRPGSETVGYRTIPDTDYVQIYTMQDGKPPIDQSTSLIVSAHGGYIDADLSTPAIALPADITLAMLTPHDTMLLDPTVDAVINDINFEAYATFRGELTKVKFIPQNHAEWLFGSNYDPADVMNTHGPVKGLTNYRHIQFEENPWVLWSAVRRNRQRALTDNVARADVLVVNDGIVDFWQSDPGRASVARLLELDARGGLVNAHGERYRKLIFSHCRSNFDVPRNQVSTYRAISERLMEVGRARSNVWQRAIYMTTFSRSRGDLSFARNIQIMYAYLYRKPLPGDDRTTPSPGSA